MPVFADESTSQHKSIKDRGRQTSKQHEENAEEFVKDLERKQKKKNRKTKSKVEEEEVQGDAPERKKKKKKHKSTKAKKDEGRSVEEEGIEQNNTPKIKKKKNKKNKKKRQDIKGNKQRFVEEDIEKHVEDYKGIRQKKETRKRKEEVEVQNDAPRKKKRKHERQETKEIKQRSAEEEDKEKHVEDYSGYRQEKETRKRNEGVEVQNDAHRKKKRKHERQETKEIKQRSAEEEEGKLEHKHQRNKTRNNMRKKTKKEKKRIQNDESNNEESVIEESNKTEPMLNPELTESTENQQILGNVPDQRKKRVKAKKSKENTAKPHDEDVNPIHFDWDPSKEEKQKFNVRQGKWTKKEEKILQENMENYLLENNLDDPSNLIFSHLRSNSDEARKWKRFSISTDFYRKLGKGLNRSIYLIYRKVLRSFDEENYVGPFTESEDRELEKLLSIHGRKWAKLGRMMGRSDLSVRHRYRWKSGSRGKWKDSEVDLLKKGVRKVTNTTEGEEIFTNINWSTVASIVKTRNVDQCRKKWILEICWKETTSAPYPIWSWKDDLKLIKLLYESSVTDETEIDWCELHKHFETSRSPEWLHTKFTLILRKYCDSLYLANADFEEVIDYLYNVKRKEVEDKYDHN